MRHEAVEFEPNRQPLIMKASLLRYRRNTCSDRPKAAFRGLSIVAALHSPKLTLSPVPLLLNDGDVRNIFRAYQSAFFCLGGCVLPVN